MNFEGKGQATTDDLIQPVDVAAAAQDNSFYTDLARAVADAPERTRNLETSFFRRFEKSRG